MAGPPPTPRSNTIREAEDRPRRIASRISRRALVRWAIGVVAFALLYGGLLLLIERLNLRDVAHEAAEQAGLWGVLLFLCLMASAVMSPLPDSPIALAGLLVYGPVAGLALVVGGSWLGAVTDFTLVRFLGRGPMRRHFPGLTAIMDDLAGRLGFELLVVLRILPTVTFDVVSYAAAVTRVSFAKFAVATLLGQLPGPTIAAVVGAGVGGSDTRVTVALSGFAFVLIVVLLALQRVIRRRQATSGKRKSGGR